MTQVRVINAFNGSAINRDDLGRCVEGSEIEVSANDAQYLEREGYVERIATSEPEATPTGLTTSSFKGQTSTSEGGEPAGTGVETSDDAGDQGSEAGA